MADENYIIDVTVEAIDKTSEPLQQAQKHISEFDRATQSTAKRVEALSRSPFDLAVRGVDKASSVMDTVSRKGLSLARKPVNITIKALDYATAPMRGIMNMMTSYQTYMLGFAAAGVGYAAVAWPLQLADNLQSANIAFTTMLGSAQKAKAFMQQVQQFAIATPFSTQDIVKNAQFMMALGFKANQIIPSLQAIGDAASAMGGSADTIQRIILALGQMQAHGKVDAQDMLQLTSANIPAWQILADKMHLTIAQVQKLAQAGKLEAAPAVQTIIKGMEQLYGGQMQKNANATFSGIRSQITDTFKIDIVTKWGQGIERAVLPEMAKFNDWLGKNQSAIDHVGNSLADVAQHGAQWFMDKLDAIARATETMTQSADWQNATTFGGKLQVAWHDVVIAPFDSWWAGPGKQEVAGVAGNIGSFFGSMLNGMISGALGLASAPETKMITVSTRPANSASLLRHLSSSDRDQYLQSFTKNIPANPFVSAGQTAGSAFFNAFFKAFDAGKIAGKLVEAFNHVQPYNQQTAGGKIAGTVVDLAVLGLGARLLKGAVGTAETGSKIWGWLTGASKGAGAASAAGEAITKGVSKAVGSGTKEPIGFKTSSWPGADASRLAQPKPITGVSSGIAERAAQYSDVIKAGGKVGWLTRIIGGIGLGTLGLGSQPDQVKLTPAEVQQLQQQLQAQKDAKARERAANASIPSYVGYNFPSNLKPGYWFGSAQTSKQDATPVSSKQVPQTNNTVHVSASVNMPVSVTGGDKDSILDVMRNNAKLIAMMMVDEVAYQLGNHLERVHTNLPVMTE